MGMEAGMEAGMERGMEINGKGHGKGQWKWAVDPEPRQEGAQSRMITGLDSRLANSPCSESRARAGPRALGLLDIIYTLRSSMHTS